MKNVETNNVPEIMTIANELYQEKIPFTFIENGLKAGNTTVKVLVNENMTDEEEEKEFLDKLWVIEISDGERQFRLFNNNEAIATVRILYNNYLKIKQQSEGPDRNKYSIFCKNNVHMLGIKSKYMDTLETTEEIVEYLKTVFVLDEKDLALMSRLSRDELREFIAQYRNHFKNRPVNEKKA